MSQAKPDKKTPEQRPMRQRLAWLAVIWCASVLSLTLVGYCLRLLMNAAGLTAP